MLKTPYQPSMGRFQGLLLTRAVPREQFTIAFNALNERLEGAHVNRWHNPDILQGRLAVLNDAEMAAKYKILKESLGILSIGAVNDVRPVDVSIFGTTKLRLRMMGVGADNLVVERGNIEQVTQHYLTSTIYSGIGGFSISDPEAFNKSIASALENMVAALPEQIKVNELDVVTH